MKKIFFLLFSSVFLFTFSTNIEIDQNYVNKVDTVVRNSTESGFLSRIFHDPFLTNFSIYYIKKKSTQQCLENDDIPCYMLFSTEIYKLSVENSFPQLPPFFEFCRFYGPLGDVKEHPIVLISVIIEEQGKCNLFKIDEKSRNVSQIEDTTILSSYQISWNDKIFFHIESSNQTKNKRIIGINEKGEEILISQREFENVAFPVLRPNFVDPFITMNEPLKYRKDTNEEALFFVSYKKRDHDDVIFKIEESTNKVLNVSKISKENNNTLFQIGRDNFFVANKRFGTFTSVKIYFWNPVDELAGYIFKGILHHDHDNPILLISRIILSNETSFLLGVQPKNDKFFQLARCVEERRCVVDETFFFRRILKYPRGIGNPSGTSFEHDLNTRTPFFLSKYSAVYRGIDDVISDDFTDTKNTYSWMSGVYDVFLVYEKCFEDKGYCIPYINTNDIRNFRFLNDPNNQIGSLRMILNLQSTLGHWIGILADLNNSSQIIIFDWKTNGDGCLPSCSKKGSNGCLNRECICKEHFLKKPLNPAEKIFFGTCDSCELKYYSVDCNVYCDPGSTCFGNGNCNQENGTCECENEYFSDKFCSECVIGRDINSGCKKCSEGYIENENNNNNCERWTCQGLPHTDSDSCNEHGTCIGIEKCRCHEGYTFDNFCQRYKCGLFFSNQTYACNGHGKCISSMKCLCSEGWVGEICQKTDSTGFSFWIATIIMVICIIPICILVAMAASYLSFLKRRRHLQMIIDQQAGFGSGGIVLPPLDEEINGNDDDENIMGHFVELETEEEEDQQQRLPIIETTTTTTTARLSDEIEDEILNLSKQDESKFTLVEYLEDDDNHENYDDNDYNY